MARKERSEVEQQGRRQVLGAILAMLAVFLLLALFSYDRRDLDFNRVPANANIHNLIGRVGARTAWLFFFVMGAGAYLTPVLLLAFGVGAFIRPVSRLLSGWRVWVGAAGLVISCAGMLDLHRASLGAVQESLDSISPGGWLGYVLNQNLLVYLFNRFGATVLYSVLYVLSLWLISGFDVVAWARSVRERWAARRAEAEAEPPATGVLERKARDLEEKARRLRERLGDDPFASGGGATAAPGKGADKVEKGKDRVGEKPKPEVAGAGAGAGAGMTGLGPDMKPVPEPTFRDHSAPSTRAVSTGNPFGGSAAAANGRADAVESGTTISAREVAATMPEGEGSAARSSGGAAAGGSGKEAGASGSNGAEPEVGGEGELTGGGASGAAGGTGAGAPGGVMRGRGATMKRPRPIAVASTPMIGNYQLPSMEALNLPDLSVKPTETKEDLMANSRLMVQTLAQFGIEAAPGDITRGPTITRYELHPAPGVKLERIAALTNNIAAALKAERIHILAPVPGRSSVGIEVPNAVKTKVIMRDLLESPEWVNSKAKIPLCLGKDVYGHPMIADLAEMPHLLIAGSTGSGKSVCINAIIASLLFRFSPDQLRFVMIDPKVVELQQYNALPHLVVPVVTDPKKVVLALRWVVNEMEKRYQIFARVGVRNIKSFNERPKEKLVPNLQEELPLTVKKEKVEPGAEGFAVEVDEEIVVPRDEDILIPEKLSYIVVIIDELADLMLVAPADVEMAIARITQMARAAGIHCIVATQRPSVDVITGVIKANIPARIAFQVAAKVDSRTILDQMGADKLLGKGDMLYLPPGSAKLTRAQGVLITDSEIEQVVDHIAKQGKPSYEAEIHHALQKAPSSLGQMNFDGEPDQDEEDEELVAKCVEVIRVERKASVSLLQRRLKLGYGRASRMMDVLEDRGIVGPSKGAEPRDILVDLDGEGYDGNGQQMV